MVAPRRFLPEPKMRRLGYEISATALDPEHHSKRPDGLFRVFTRPCCALPTGDDEPVAQTVPISPLHSSSREVLASTQSVPTVHLRMPTVGNGRISAQVTELPLIRNGVRVVGKPKALEPEKGGHPMWPLSVRA